MIRNFLIVSLLIVSFIVFGQTSGTLTVTATTSRTSSPEYGNNHIVAFWVQDSNGKYVKTILAYANERKQYLKNWKTATTIAGSSYNVVDAITGATKTSHASRTGNWNGKNTSSVEMADGTYIVKLELTDNESGVQNYTNFSITKGPVEQILTPSSISGFSNISLKWSPSNTAVVDIEGEKLFSIYPNPAKNNIYVSGFGISLIDILDIQGRVILSSENQQIELSKIPSGVYFCKIYSSQTDVIKKFIKQ